MLLTSLFVFGFVLSPKFHTCSLPLYATALRLYGPRLYGSRRLPLYVCMALGVYDSTLIPMPGNEL